jgi:hypothetical protein
MEAEGTVMKTKATGTTSRPSRSTEKVRSTDSRRAGRRVGPSSTPSSTPATPGDAAPADSPEPSRPKVPLTRAQAIRELADRANRGSEEALARLRRLLDDCPEIWDQVGDLARHAELAWLDLVAGADHLMLESIKRHIARMKDDLLGPHPTVMERLLVDQAVACYLSVRHAELALAAPGSCSPAQAAMRLRRAESAQRGYLATLKTLARLRATVPQGMAPLKPLRLHTGEQQQA